MEQTSPHTELTAASHTPTDKPVTPSQLVVAEAVAQQLLVAMHHNQELTVRPELVATVAKVLQIRGPQEHLLFTEVAAVDRLVLCKESVEQTAVLQVAPIPQAEQALTQSTKQVPAVAADIAKEAVAPVMVVQEL
jgi:hypothetical protein